MIRRKKLTKSIYHIAFRMPSISYGLLIYNAGYVQHEHGEHFILSHVLSLDLSLK